MSQGAPMWLDRLLELSVVGSWSNVGWSLRHRGWSDDPGSCVDRRVLVTGGTRGIGRAAAEMLSECGASVGIVGRDEAQTRRSADEIQRRTGGPVWSHGADLTDLCQVEALARAVIGWAPDGLDGLVHCAGQLVHQWRLAPSGTEFTVALHVVGPHLLTYRLRPLLNARSTSTLVWVSSGGQYTQSFDIGGLEMDQQSFRGSVAYARAKCAQVVLAQLWDSRFHGQVRSYAVHPGWVDTDALRSGLPRFARMLRPILRTPEQGADTLVWLTKGAAPPDSAAALWFDRRPRPTQRWPVKALYGEPETLWRWVNYRAGLDELGKQ
jgi:dehydrogenase/reductase SDR family member 12